MKINRNIISMLYDDFSTNVISILIGARQVGKTYLLGQLKKEAQRRGLKPRYFDLEQPSDLMLFNQSDEDIIQILISSGEVVLIDEFHYLKNASRIFKAIYDRKAPVKIFASGSSSLEIHSHLKESLVGRKQIYPIYPCCLGEISQVITKDPVSYLCTFGGNPGTIHIPDEKKKKLLLSDILQSYLLKDVKALIREENLRAFNHLLFLLAQSQGNIVSVSSLANEVGLTARTVDTHLDILAQTYVLFPLHSYRRNFANELKKSKKYYLYDLGIRNALLKNFAPLGSRKDVGAIMETFVFLELQNQLSPETEIRFWRLKGGEEVDFLWIKNQEAYPIEVKGNCQKGQIPSGLKTFLRRYPETQKAYIINRSTTGDSRFQDIPVYYRKFHQAATIPKEI